MFGKNLFLKIALVCLLSLIARPSLYSASLALKQKALQTIRSNMLQCLFYNASPIYRVLDLGKTQLTWKSAKPITYGHALHGKDLNVAYDFFSSGSYKASIIPLTSNSKQDKSILKMYGSYQHNLLLLAFTYYGIENFFLQRYKFKNVNDAKGRKGSPEVRKLILEGVKHILSRKFRLSHDYHVTYTYHYYANYTTPVLSAVAILLFDEFNGKNNKMSSVEKSEFATVYNDLKSYCEILGYGGAQTTGANWAIRHKMNALLYLAAASDVKVMDKFIKQHDVSMRRLNDEGVTYDYSFFHHEFTHYWGKYGSHYLNLSMDLGIFLEETPWKFPTWKKRFIRNCVLDGWAPVVYRGNIMGLEGGKASMVHGSTIATKEEFLDSVLKAVKLWGMDEFAGKRKNEVKQYINNFDSNYRYTKGDANRSELVGHKVYWYSAKQTHRRPNYAIMVGRFNRWVGSPEREQKVQPDLSFATSSYYAFGYTAFLTKGPEHTDARAAWDFTTLPGTTVAIGMRGMYKYKQNDKIKVRYSGGATDGMYGVGGFICDAKYQDDKRVQNYTHSIVSTKGTFFFDDEAVMIGQNISRKYKSWEQDYPSPPWQTGDDNPVWTTLEHTDARSKITYHLGGKSTIQTIHKRATTDTSLKIKTQGDIAWFHHDDKGYLIIGKNKNVVLEMKKFPAYKARFSLGWYEKAMAALGDRRSESGLSSLRRSIDRKLKKKYKKKLKAFSVISNPKLEVIGNYPLMRLAVDHGTNPHKDDYVYVLLPNVTAAEVEQYAKKLPFTFINQTGIQAVIHNKLNMVQVLFYKNNGSIKLKLDGKEVRLTASKYAAILLARDKDDKKTYRISVADPTYSSSSLKVVIEGLALSLDNKKTDRRAVKATAVKANGNKTSLKFKLPQKNVVDKTITAHLILL